MTARTFGTRMIGSATSLGIIVAAASIAALSEKPAEAQTASVNLATACTAANMGEVAGRAAAGTTVHQVTNGPRFADGVRLVAAKGKVPAYCQVTGSYVTNPKTGRTANFIATFPERWNGRYLQLGCSGTCGFLLMNDPSSPPITITAQGYPGQLMEKGYAIFGNDLGHQAKGPSEMSFAWLKKADGGIDLDAMEDYLYRADSVMADFGKAFTLQFYSQQTGKVEKLIRSYFSGCSQGGREALVAAARFPEKFDGIIAGSPLSDQPGTLWHQLSQASIMQQEQPAKLSSGQLQTLKARVIAQCDALDGVKDGVIQNPAACNVSPTAGMAICKPGTTSDSCLTSQQARTLSGWLSATTTTTGKVIQPGYSVSDQGYGTVMALPANMPVDADMRYFIGKQFAGVPLLSLRTGGKDGIASYHGVINQRAYDKYLSVVRQGTILPEDFNALLARKGKLLWYHNLSDEALTPFMSFNRYKRLAALHGGYAKLQQNIRFFALPGTGHCGMSGSAPSNFDAIGALEAWVEQGRAPQALLARQNDPAKSSVLAGMIDWSQPAVRTMPLCTFPQMASYRGTGDVNDAANWSCKSSDRRMLDVGLSGRNAGVLR